MGNPIDINTLAPFNLAGVRAYTASQGSWPTGGYELAVVGIRGEVADSGGAMLVVSLQARNGKLASIPENAEHDYQREVHGKTMTKWVTIPGTAPSPDKEEHYRGGMRGFLESLGFGPAQIDQNLRPADIAAAAMGRTCYVWVVESTTTHQGDSSWMTPAQWQAFQQNQWAGKLTSKPREDGAKGSGGPVNMPTIGQQNQANALQNLAQQGGGGFQQPQNAPTAPTAPTGNLGGGPNAQQNPNPLGGENPLGNPGGFNPTMSAPNGPSAMQNALGR